MDLTAIVKELMEERDIIDAAISSLERIAQHRGKRRGRPPAWMSIIAEDEPKKSKKRGRPRKVAQAGK